MRAPWTQLYVHLVWATWDRLPLIRPEVQAGIYGCIQEQAQKRKCDVMAIGGVADHVHLLIRFPTTLVIAELVQHAKGASSNLMTQVLDPGAFFKWQAYYGAFTVGKAHLEWVTRYIHRQEEHHRTGQLAPVLERVTEE